VLQSGPNGGSWLKVPNVGATGDLVSATVGPSGLRVIGGYNELRLGAPTTWLNELDSAKTLPAPATDYYALLWDGTQIIAAGEAGHCDGRAGDAGF